MSQARTVNEQKRREATWRRTVLSRRRDETRRRQQAINARRRAVDGRGTAEAKLYAELAADADRRLAATRRALAEAEAALAKVRKQIAESADHAPRIITSTQLGLRFQDVFGPRGRIWRWTGHYSAGPRAHTHTEGVARAREFHRAHLAKGWGGCSYDVIVSDDGTLFLMNPIGRKGAHVALNNTGNVGLNCPGNVGDKPTAAGEATIRWYLRNAHTKAIPAPWRSPVPLLGVKASVHKDWMATACPGAFEPMYRRVS